MKQPCNVVYLHGYGGDGSDVTLLEEHCPVALNWVAPRSSRRLNGMREGGRAWWYWDIPAMERRLLDTGDPTDLIDPLGTPDGLEAASEAVAVYASRLPGGQRNTVVAGISQGAILALDSAMTAFAVQPVGVFLMSPGVVRAEEWIASMDGMKDVPILITHGRRDNTLPLARATWLAEMLDKAGARVTMVTFRGGHGMPPPRLVHSWLADITDRSAE